MYNIYIHYNIQYCRVGGGGGKIVLHEFLIKPAQNCSRPIWKCAAGVRNTTATSGELLSKSNETHCILRAS